MSEVCLAFLGQIYLTGLTCDDVQVLGADCRCSCVSADQISVADWCQRAAQPLPVSVKIIDYTLAEMISGEVWEISG